MSRLITLLTDFGTQDVYVGVMKGVIAQICPEARVIDLTHAIPPQDLIAARFNLMNAVPYFPARTIYVMVVDPGVGTERRSLALQTPEGLFVGPDNGVFSGIVDNHPDRQAVELSNPDYWRVPDPSPTFHGRDIFAPVAAHLASGVAIAALGSPISVTSPVRLPIPAAHQAGGTLHGTLQYIDHFGNLITTIPGEWVGSHQTWALTIHGQTIGAVNTYGDVAPQQLAALVGSHGWVEVAVNGGNAQARFQAQVGDGVEVVLEEEGGRRERGKREL